MTARPHLPQRLRFVSPAVGLMVALTLVLTACGSAGKGTTGPDTELTAVPAAQASAPPANAKVIAVTVNGTSVSPSGVQVQVQKGQPIVFQITADKAGELHVHSTPAQAIHYPAGRSQAEVTIDQPGLIEAEIEQLGKLVVELEVR